MKTIKAIYDHGKIILLEKPQIAKTKILVTFLDDANLSEIKKEQKVKFPTKDLGRIINIDRENIYAEYLSD